MPLYHAIIGPDSNNSWTWASEKLVGIPGVVRVLVTLHRAGIQQVTLPDNIPNVKRVIETWRKKDKKMPGILWQSPDKLDFSPTESEMLYIRGGIIFETGVIQWLRKTAAEFPEGNICVKDEHDRIAWGVFRGLDRPEQNPLHLAPEKICSQSSVPVVSPPDQLFHRPFSELEKEGSGRALLEMLGKPDEAAHVKWIRKKTFPLLRILSETRITPNQLTWLGFLLGVIGAFFIAAGGYRGGVFGALLLCGSWLFDGIDGTLARLTFSESPRGEKLDSTLGHLTNITFFIALVWAVFRTSSLLKIGLFTFLMMISIAVAHRLCQAEKRLRKDGTGADTKIKRLQVLLEQINGRDFAVLILLFAILDGFEFFLWGSLLGLQAFWMVHLWLILRYRRKRVSIST